MRILAIRGRNLASLADDFAIDFEAPPLADAGIFAITGPTGAGKSTLLDAVCLALFNDIPRLRTAPASGKIGGEDEDSGLSLRDSRAILRHGAGDGFAEVDFAMPGGGRYMPGGTRYRARWSVKRARGKADGRLQKVEHSFERLDSAERLGGTLTETLAAIREVIGLTVEQFGRAVLLAQGDFDAFIRADANERAVLLERLTGSEIYARLGRQAFEKAQGHKDGLESIRQQIAAQNGLDDSQRTEAEAQFAAAQADEAAANAQCAMLATARQWEEQGARLTALIAQTREQVAAAQLACEAAAARRIALERDRKAFALAPSWTALATALTNRDAAAAQVIAGERTAATAHAEALRTRAIEEQARAAQQAQAAHAAAIAPSLEAARALELHVTAAATACDEARAKAEARHADRGEAETTHAKARAAHETAIEAHRAHADWLAANPAPAALAAREAELAGQLAEHTGESAAIVRAEAECAQQETAQAAALAGWTQADAALATATAGHKSALGKLDEARSALPPEIRLTELTEARDRLTRIDGLLTAYSGAEDVLTEADHALVMLRGKQAEIARRSDDLTDRLATLQAALPALNARLNDAQRELDLLTAAASETAEGLRAGLVPGEPCPVCGSSAHQLSVFEGKLGDHLRTRREGVAALAQEHGATAQAAAKAATERDLLTDQSARAKRDIAEHVLVVEAKSCARDFALASLATDARTAGLPVASEALPEALSMQRAATDAALAALQSARMAEMVARSAEEQARTALDQARTNRDAARDALAEHVRALDDATADLGRRRERAGQLAVTLDHWLAPAEPDWRAHPNPADWLSAQAAAWRERSAARDELAAALPDLRDVLTRSEASLTTAQVRAREACEEIAAANTAHAALAAERAALLGGEAVAAVEARLASASKTAGADLKAAHEGHSAAESSLAAATAALAERRRHAAAAEASHAQAEADFERALSESALGRGDVERVALAGEPALRTEAEALAALDRALDLAAGMLHQREADYARHEAGTRPELTGTALAAASFVAEAARDAAADARGEADLKLRMDDAVRTRTAALRAELERQSAAADVWLRLGQLIGDAKGANFRRFAQGLTLDRLLEHANARLSELKPRYTLQRGAGGDMLIEVVDNDMGGQVRGLLNLSGGERFLASLALALGLAEMSTTNGVKIETLFIDEGFGALDPASLGQAVALLEHLHATGRRVGVISHVEELKERIAAKIEVTPTGRGTSRIEVVAG